MADPTNVVNPGLVNVADQADGLVSVDQTIGVAVPSTNSGPTSRGLEFADGETLIDQGKQVLPPHNDGPTSRAADLEPGVGLPGEVPSGVGAPQIADDTVQGGTASPTSPNVVETTENTVVGQESSVQQFFETQNVFV